MRSDGARGRHRQAESYLPTRGLHFSSLLSGAPLLGGKKKKEPIVENGPLALPRGHPHLCLTRGGI